MVSVGQVGYNEMQGLEVKGLIVKAGFGTEALVMLVEPLAGFRELPIS